MWPSKTATEEQNTPKAKYDPPYYVHMLAVSVRLVRSGDRGNRTPDLSQEQSHHSLSWCFYTMHLP